MADQSAFRQHHDRSWLRSDWDVAVVGAGPAGSMVALHLARQGHAVVVLEKESFPREKVCGDAWLPDAVRCLQRAGIHERFAARAYRASELRVFSPGGVCVRVPGEYLTLRRHDADAILVAEAVAGGAVLVHATVASLAPAREGGWDIAVDGVTAPGHARIVVVATGANVALLEGLGMITARRPTAVALRCYVTSSCPLDFLVGSFDRSIIPGYAWIFPVGGGVFNVGCGVTLNRDGRAPVNLRSTFGTFVRSFPLAKELMAHASEISAMRGAMLRCGLAGCRPASARGVVAVGEALGATLPFTGEGIGKAMETAEIAAEAVDEALRAGTLAPLASYAGRLEARLRRRYRAHAAAQRWQSFPWLNDLVARRTLRSQYLRAAMAGIITETTPPDEIFSIRGICRSLWR